MLSIIKSIIIEVLIYDIFSWRFAINGVIKYFIYFMWGKFLEIEDGKIYCLKKKNVNILRVQS